MGIVQDLDKILGAGDSANVKLPDLDWLALTTKDVDNIPSEVPVQSIPQLVEQWSNTSEKSANFIPNNVAVPTEKVASVSEEDIRGVVATAKKQLMLGVPGKELSAMLTSMYTPEVIQASKDELVKVAAEMGLLGNVYVDMSAYDSCKQAQQQLGHRVRLAKYVVGTPAKCCRMHKTGYCTELKKKVVAEVLYDDNLFGDYTMHLKVAGLIGPEDKISSKEELQACFCKCEEKSCPPQETKDDARDAQIDTDIDESLKASLVKQVEATEAKQADEHFLQAREILSYVQDQMLRGHMGDALKEDISKKFPEDQIQKYASEIRKAASLQGLLGNVYVDVSFYKDATDAIKSIKSASTNPTYLVQSRKVNEFDGTMAKVAKATGCSPLPRDGKIDKKIAMSYISDLQFNKKISSVVAEDLRKRIEANDNFLSVLREAFLSSLEHKEGVQEGGVQAYEYSGENNTSQKKASKSEEVKSGVQKALEAGVSVDDVEDKISTMIPATEAMGMVRTVLASMSEVDAKCLSKCTTEKYQMLRTASIKKADKCSNCILCGNSGCLKHGLKFAGSMDLDKAFFDFGKEASKKGDPGVEPHIKELLPRENPDVERQDMQQDYDMSDGFGSGMNIALDRMRNKDSSLDIDMGQVGENMNL